ncbi:hypothetical protein ACIGNX_01785 [Actinosynnema sp. NPDC053489]|uniref:hypothetical protein n=1 Tax=Actinosynnema sp. NPDC053489 TaxID=3363916 RepID=UPI0037CB3057
MADIEDIVAGPKGYGDIKDDPTRGNWDGPPGEYYAGLNPPPKVPKNDKKPTKGTRVDTKALLTFAANIRSLIPMLESVRDKLGKVEIKPGSFYDASQLTLKSIGGPAGVSIKETTRDFVETAINAITTVADELERLAKQYETVEELNKATGLGLGEHIENARTAVIAAVGGATSLG